MQAISHSDLITKIKNTEGEVLARIEGEDFCCNPTQETLVDLGLAEPVADEPEAEAADDETGGDDADAGGDDEGEAGDSNPDAA